MLYTILSIDDVMRAPPQEGMFAAAEGAVRLTVLREHRVLEVEMDREGPRLVRLISTDPADYLDPRWQPGAPVALRPGELPREGGQGRGGYDALVGDPGVW